MHLEQKMENIEKIVITVLSEVLEVNTDNLNNNSNYENTKGWDSLATTNFIVAIENEFDITIDLEDAEQFVCVENVIRILNEQL